MTKENRVPQLKIPGTASSPGSAVETCIDRQTVVTGNIDAKGAVCIDGQVNGDVASGGDLHISGCINGNVAADNIFLTGGSIQGCINARGAVKTDSAAKIKGDIAANSLECNCKVEGNINIAEAAVLLEKALLVGDLNAATLRIENGAPSKASCRFKPLPRVNDHAGSSPASNDAT
jgi:cytoskeletal protein CcmA (bactofilin family)